MRSAIAFVPEAPAAHRSLFVGRAGSQPWPVSGWIRDRFLVTYRAPAPRLASIVPPPFEVDTLEGEGFVSVCALRAERMGLWGTPWPFRFDNLEFLYRIGVRVDGEATFLTLRSDVSAWQMATLGERFSHYRPLRAAMEHTSGELWTLRCHSSDGRADAQLSARMGPSPSVLSTSVFPSASAASDFLVGMAFAAAVRADGRVQVQPIAHPPWDARFVQAPVRRFCFLDELAAAIGSPLAYDSTLHMHGIDQRWQATRVR